MTNEQRPVTATYETQGEASAAPTPPEQPQAHPNITALPPLPRPQQTGKWMIYVAGALLVSAAFALLFSLMSMEDEERPNRRRSRQRPFNADWSDGLLGDDDDDDGDWMYSREERGARRRPEGRERRASGEGRYQAPAATAPAPSMPSFVPPIIINTPGQAPAVFGGGQKAGE